MVTCSLWKGQDDAGTCTLQLAVILGLAISVKNSGHDNNVTTWHTYIALSRHDMKSWREWQDEVMTWRHNPAIMTMSWPDAHHNIVTWRHDVTMMLHDEAVMWCDVTLLHQRLEAYKRHIIVLRHNDCLQIHSLLVQVNTVWLLSGWLSDWARIS